MIKFLIVLEQPDMNSSRRLRYWELSHNTFLDSFCVQSKHGTDKIESSPWLAVLLLQDHGQIVPVGLVHRLQIVKKA